MTRSLLQKQKRRLKRAAKRASAVAAAASTVAAVDRAAAKAAPVSGSGRYIAHPMRGRGGYFSDLANSVVSVGAPIVKGVGSVADFISGIVGRGSYRAKAAAATQRYKQLHQTGLSSEEVLAKALEIANPGALAMGGSNLSFSSGADTLLMHTEYVGPVYSSTGFSTTSIRVQPGLNTFLPWGSNVAQCFQMYDAEGIIFEYRTTSSQYTTTGNLGKVMMSTLYDANAAPLGSESSIENNDYTTSENQAVSFIHPVECATQANVVTTRFIRTATSSDLGDTDLRLDDLGLFQISVVGCQNSGVKIGDLYVAYKLRLKKPFLPSSSFGTAFHCYFQLSNASGSVNFSGFTYDPGNRLPATVVLTPNPWPVPGTDCPILVSMPVGYSGTFMAILIGTDSSGTGGDIGPCSGTTGSPNAQAVGTDISNVNLLQTANFAGNPPNNNTGTTLYSPGSNGNIPAIFCVYTFSNASAVPGQGTFQFVNTAYPANGQTITYEVWVIPIPTGLTRSPLSLRAQMRALQHQVEMLLAPLAPNSGGGTFRMSSATSARLVPFSTASSSSNSDLSRREFISVEERSDTPSAFVSVTADANSHSSSK